MNSSDQQRALLEVRAKKTESAAVVSKHHSLEKALKSAMAKIQVDETLQPLAEEIFTRVIHKVLGQYQSKVNAGMQDSLTDLLTVFKQKVLSHILNSADSWRVRNREACLFPVGCRYFYSRGNSTVVVIEQQPQTRALLFSSGMMGDEITSGRYDSPVRVLLALPYVYFVLCFREDQLGGHNPVLAQVYSAWRTSPVLQLGDTVSIPLLPNTHGNCMICMGDTHISGGSIAEISSNAISNYWNSQFTGDLSDYWWHKSSLDHRLASGKKWAECSLDDPTFILSVRLPSDYTVKILIDRLTANENEPGELDVRNKLTAAVDNCVETLFAKILRYFKHTKFDHFYPKESTSQVSQALESVVKEMSDVLLALEYEINQLGESVRDLQPGLHWKKRGELWQDPC